MRWPGKLLANGIYAKVELFPTQELPSAMPNVKEQSTVPKFTLEQRYEAPLRGLDNGVINAFQKAADVYGLRKSSLGQQKRSHQMWDITHQEQQSFTTAAEEAIVKWIRKLDDYGFSPGIDNLLGMVKQLAKHDFER